MLYCGGGDERWGKKIYGKKTRGIGFRGEGRGNGVEGGLASVAGSRVLILWRERSWPNDPGEGGVLEVEKPRG